MVRTWWRGIAIAVSAAGLAAGVAHVGEPDPAQAQSAPVMAGAAAVDASWHVGASAGQYAGDCFNPENVPPDPSQPCTAVDPVNGNYDPAASSFRRRPSYGMQSRLSARALVIKPIGGAPIAVVKTDMYIPQDLLYRRAAQLLEQEGDCGVTRSTLTLTASHDHSSPMYSSTAWGVWAFQDAFDIRFYDYMSRRIFMAVERACDDLVPARIGASVGQFDKTHRHSFGPAIADDNTPAGYPFDDTDQDLTVIRFDDVSDPSNPRPLANLVNWSGHPESLSGNDLISADYIGPVERMTDRATGALTIFTQGAVGSAEPERSTNHPIRERLEFPHREYGQADYAGRLLSDAIIRISKDVETPGGDPREVPFATSLEVSMIDRWYPGPFSHPYPGVSNCRFDKGLEGDPQLPIVGLPTCQGSGQNLQAALLGLSEGLGLPVEEFPWPDNDPGLSTDDFEALGIPVPENYSAPSYTGLQEDIDVHLQGIRIGEIYLPICSCEQWYDQSKNIETRTDKIADNEYLGYDWGAQCMSNGATPPTWTCPNPQDPAATLSISDDRYERMRAQVLNDASGWNDAQNAPYAESESTNPDECSEPATTPPNCIWGNYTQDDACGLMVPVPRPDDRPCAPAETSPSAALGYTLTVPISMANDYNGYIATYREYQRGDHYRKALTGWGPHSSDYMASRLVTIGRQLKDSSVALPLDQSQEQLLVAKAMADTALNDARAQALGAAAAQLIPLYEQALPDEEDAGEPVDQPDAIERFGAAFFTWNGGSNYTDDPVVRVQRQTATGWRDFADQSGEIPVTLEFPQTDGAPAYLAGDQEWRWTAHFEAFVAPFDTGAGDLATPPGTYRFVVDGLRRSGGETAPYHLESRPFAVRPWSGITAEDLRLESDGTLSFRIGPRRHYDVPAGGDEDARPVAPLGGGPAIADVEIGPIDYPDTYRSPARFIDHVRYARRDPAAPGDGSRLEWFCFACSFRPWIDAGDAAGAEVTILDENRTTVVQAQRVGDRWVTQEVLQEGQTAFVEVGGVQDRYENFNGARSNVISLNGPPPPPEGTPPEPPVQPPGGGGGGGAPGTYTESGRCQTETAGTDAGDKLFGTAGSDLLRGLRGRDRLKGGAGPDCLRGGADRDRLKGGGGGDMLAGGRGSDRIRGGGGDDDIRAARGRGDFVDCGPGNDRVTVGRRDVTRRCERVVD